MNTSHITRTTYGVHGFSMTKPSSNWAITHQPKYEPPVYISFSFNRQKPPHKYIFTTTVYGRSDALSCHSFVICQNILAFTLKGQQWQACSVCVCVRVTVTLRGMGASTAKAKQAALICRDLWLPLIISLGVRSWVWLLRTRILNGPSACSLIVTGRAAVDGITVRLFRRCRIEYCI